MKIFKLSLILAAAVLVTFGLSGTSFAFHSGGVAECTGCHEMHGANGLHLLQGHDDSSTCLNCHQPSTPDAAPSGYHISTPESALGPGVPPTEMTPGGDFGWLKKTYIFTVRGSVNTELGVSHGHDINATDYNYPGMATDNTTAPGGTFPQNQLGCPSCHDMHGQGRYVGSAMTYAKTGAPIIASGSYNSSPTPTDGAALGVYRLLRGGGDTVDGVTFNQDPPFAVTNSTYNRSEYYTQTRTAYSIGMSDFCGTCHPDMHSTAGILRHPQGVAMSGTIDNNYNAYVASGNLTGNQATSYLSLVPFEEGLARNAANYATLKSHAQINDSQLGGPSTGVEQVMCVSCHRAHASEWPEMTRWNNEGEFMVYNSLYPGTDSTPSVPQFSRGRNSTETAAGYYNRNVTKFATYQRVLCNKCHAKD